MTSVHYGGYNGGGTTSTSYNDGGSGGGGYYGGGRANGFNYAGGGGSGFVTGYTGCDTTYRNNHKGINNELLNFTDVVMQNGVKTGNESDSLSLVRIDDSD